MSGLSLGDVYALAERFDFGRYGTVCDVGGATGRLCMTLAGRYSHQRCTTYDQPVVARAAVAEVQRHRLGILSRCRLGPATAETHVLQKRVGDLDGLVGVVIHNGSVIAGVSPEQKRWKHHSEI